MNVNEKININELELKQRRFNSAMDLFANKSIYRLIGKIVSFTNVSLQIFLLWLVFPYSIGPLLQLLSIAAAYLIADFLNGLVHMYLDNNDNYGSIAGPFVAAFHLHHKTPAYKKNSLFTVYYNETGSKIWLVGYLALSAVLIGAVKVNHVISYILVYIGILSSVAEVTHYRCHVPDSLLAKYFGNFSLFLTKRHHGKHHIDDNVNYAFLNGITDPLLNIIAKKYYPGYKNTTDRHYERYTGKGTENR